MIQGPSGIMHMLAAVLLAVHMPAFVASLGATASWVVAVTARYYSSRGPRRASGRQPWKQLQK